MGERSPEEEAALQKHVKDVKVELQAILKPCPFCGYNDIYLGRGGVNCPIPAWGTWGFVVGCKNASCRASFCGPALDEDFARMSKVEFWEMHEPKLRETAILWNRRDDAKRVE